MNRMIDPAQETEPHEECVAWFNALFDGLERCPECGVPIQRCPHRPTSPWGRKPHVVGPYRGVPCYGELGCAGSAGPCRWTIIRVGDGAVLARGYVSHPPTPESVAAQGGDVR